MDTYTLNQTLQDKMINQCVAKLSTLEEFSILNSSTLVLTLDNKERLYLSMLINAVEKNTVKVLLSMMPWMYHAYISQGYSYDLFKIELQTWDEVIKSNIDETGEELYLFNREVLQNHEKLIDASKNYLSHTVEAPESWQTTQRSFKDALIQGNIDIVKQIFHENVDSTLSLNTFYRYIIHPSMYQIGIDWENGLVSVAQEHLASSLIIQVLSLTYTLVEPSEIKKGVGLVGAVANEFHEIGAMMLANALELDGWDIHYLGPNVSDEEFIQEILRVNPSFIALSVSMPFNLSTATRLIKNIHSLELKTMPKIMIGGNAFELITSSPSLYGADAFLKNIGDALTQVNLWEMEHS